MAVTIGIGSEEELCLFLSSPPRPPTVHSSSHLPQDAAQEGLAAAEPSIACIAAHSVSVHDFLLGCAAECQECLVFLPQDRVTDVDLALTGCRSCHSASEPGWQEAQTVR